LLHSIRHFSAGCSGTSVLGTSIHDPAQTSVSSPIDKERIEELPVQSRNYLNFVLLAPGVSSSAQQPEKRPLAALLDSGFTLGGLRGRSNNASIDGLDNNDE